MTLFKSCLLVAYVLGMSFFATAGNAGQLGCHVDTVDRELTQLKRAPHSAKRIDKHSIEVWWQGGKRIFKDKPPYDEQHDGVRWKYCGYYAGPKVHLLEKSDGDVFAGVMLDDVSGAILPAGVPVLFSPDYKYYLAYEQEAGRDGATIKLYRRDGSLKWQSYDGILTPNGGAIIAYFESTQWNDKGQLQTSAICLSGKKAGILTLSKVNGQWQWLPKIRCPER